MISVKYKSYFVLRLKMTMKRINWKKNLTFLFHKIVWFFTPGIWFLPPRPLCPGHRRAINTAPPRTCLMLLSGWEIARGRDVESVNRREIFFKLSALGADRTEWTGQKNVCKTHVGNMGVISELVTQWRRWRENIGCFVVAQQESRVCISDLWPGTPGKKWPGGSFHSTFTPRRE